MKQCEDGPPHWIDKDDVCPGEDVPRCPPGYFIDPENPEDCINVILEDEPEATDTEDTEESPDENEDIGEGIEEENDGSIEEDEEDNEDASESTETGNAEENDEIPSFR